MIEWNGWFGFTVSVLILGGGMLWIRHDNLKKSAEIRAQVRKRGWRYRYYQEPGPWAWISRVTLALRSGTSSQSEHMIEGEHRGWQLKVYEQVIRSRGTGGPDGDTSYQYVRVRLQTSLGDMVLEEAGSDGFFTGVLDTLKIGRAGLRRMPVVELGDAAFTERFRVLADDPDRARSTFNSDVRSWLLADGRAARWPVTFHDTWLFSREEKHLDIEDVSARLDYLIDLLERIRVTAPRW